MLRSTHPAFIPGTDQLVICANDIEQGGGSWIYTAKGFAKVIIATSFIKVR